MRQPASTYRIQLDAGFPLHRARALVDYLAGLGVDFLYLSPVLAARHGSRHGYDVIDPGRIDPQLGGREEFEALARTLQSHGMGLLVDIVPNHMAADMENPWWRDVLAKGRYSAYADFFDIEWSTGDPDLEGRLALPLLGGDLDGIVAHGDLHAVRQGGSLLIAYFEHRLPMCAESWPLVLETTKDGELALLVARCRELGRFDAGARRRESDALEKQLEALLQARPDLREAVDAALAGLGSERLRSLLDQQHYRLRPWRGPLPLNYRRFFDVSGLVGLRVEDARVFEASHALLFQLANDGLIQGLRIDHPDGLRDPVGYLEQLERSAPDGGLFVVVEKILVGDERLRENWPVAGTTGYEQLDVLGGVLVDPAGRDALLETYARFTGETAGFEDVAFASKRQVLEQLLAPEVAALARRLAALQPAVPGDVLGDALSAVIACFGVYRTYARAGDFRMEGEDRRLVEQAVDDARRRGARPAALDVIRSALLLEPPMVHDDASGAACRELLLRFQQLTGPAAAKGVEDTASYRYVPLASLDEVGGEPDRFGVSVEQFHAHNLERAARWPGSLSASSTHDTKRSEDVRCRIGVLSGMAARWDDAVEHWHTLADGYRSSIAQGPAPSKHDEYLLYQTLVGTWPDGDLDDAGLAAFRERIQAYMLKAAREAKLSTNWVDGDGDYEAALARFIERLLDREHSADFLEDLRRFVEPVVRIGRLASLSMLVLKIAGPGVPDFYQGSELWDSSLVDPDNRRAVDFDQRRALLGELSGGTDVPALLEDLADGRLKLLLTTRGLGLRKRRARLFAAGDYHPAPATGSRSDQLVALLRTRSDDAVLAAVGRFFHRFDGAPVGDAWNDSAIELPPALPSGRYRDAFTGHILALESGTRVSASLLFRHLPYVLMERIT